MPDMTDVAAIARGLTKAQRACVLWCNSDGSPRQHDKSVARSSFYSLGLKTVGKPDREVAYCYWLVVRGEGEKVKGRMWPEDTWALTPLGLAVRTYLQENHYA